MPTHQHKQDTELKTPLPDQTYQLVETLISEKDWQEWAVSELMNGGPRHKQVYSALLLSRMQHLVHTVEQISKSRFTAVPGQEIESLKDEVDCPVLLPFTVAEKEEFSAVAETVSHSPSHEILAFNTLLQSIEWSISALSAKPRRDQ